MSDVTYVGGHSPILKHRNRLNIAATTVVTVVSGCFNRVIVKVDSKLRPLGLGPTSYGFLGSLTGL